MNRDEQRNRHETNLISHNNLNQIDYYHPVDQSSGGTWFGFNNCGFVMALLNRYQDTNTQAKTSRGIIIPTLLQSNSINDINTRLNNLSLPDFQPFDLIITSLTSCHRFSWNGKDLTNTEIPLNCPFVLSSSSIDSDFILKHRYQLFDQFKQQQNQSQNTILKNFHLQQNKKDTSSSVFMSREHTHTKSLSQVVLNKDTLKYAYYTEQNLKQMPLQCQTIDLNLSC